MFTQPFAVPAAILFLLAIPLVLGLIPRNRFYGMRTRTTLSNDRRWYSGNRVAGVAILLASGIYGAVAVAWPYDRTASDSFSTWAVHLAAFVVPLVIGLSVAHRYAKRV
jgi:uncharacterized membrane protein